MIINLDARTWDSILEEISQERERQDTKWGEQNHPDSNVQDGVWPAMSPTKASEEADTWKRVNAMRVRRGELAWDGILLEEVFEALSEEDPVKLRAELIQIAAVAVNWIEAIDRRSA